jgi:para-aminobenzoate synthetase / 4-amino-4-deoxychorismate lyase
VRPLRIILRTPWSGPWRSFTDPIRVIEAHEAGEVRKALRAVDDAVRSGSYAAGFVTYEAAAAFGLPAPAPDGRRPLVCFGIYPPDRVQPLGRLPAAGEATFGPWEPSIDHEHYLASIAAIKDRIEAGDTYQINFTFRLRAPFSGDPLGAMRQLYAAQAGPWSAFVDAGDLAICSASPELFYSADGEHLVCRPMKGTWPRGYWPAQDLEYGEQLRGSEKNRAENVMIADMVRNDLGRVARVGTVRATSLFDVERYPLQWQMVSTVEADVNGPTLARLFGAMFPCGSITGAPKHSSMGIIRELESAPRGVYTGAIGYLTPGGRSHFSVAIRTVVVDRTTGEAEFGVGSGVVWDSVDHDEYDECVLKARMLTSAVPARAASAGAAYVVDDPPRFRLLETILWTPDAGFALLDAHLARLRASATCFAFDCDIEEVRALLDGVVGDLRGPAKVRLQVGGDGSVLCEAVDLAPLPPVLRLELAAEPVDPRDVFLYHKTTNRAVYDHARASCPEADAVLLWNTSGDVTEATEANVVVELGGRKVTPPIASGLLPGTLRAALVESGEVLEARITRADLVTARSIWLVNSVRGWLSGALTRVRI